MSAQRSVSPWWALVLIPVALGAGRLIGGLPVAPKPDTASTAARPVAPPSPVALREPDRAFTHGGAPGTPTETTPGSSGSAPQPVTSRAPEPQVAADGPVHWRSLTDAIDESRRTGKPVLLDFNADWCGPCQAMKHEMFESSSHARAIESAVLPVTIVDRQREMGANPADLEALQRKFQINAFPTLVVLCPATGKAARQEGYGGADMTEAWITQAAQAVRQ